MITGLIWDVFGLLILFQTSVANKLISYQEFFEILVFRPRMLILFYSASILPEGLKLNKTKRLPSDMYRLCYMDYCKLCAFVM